MNATIKPTRAGGAFTVERVVGRSHGVAVEIWGVPSTGAALLVVFPSTEGFTVLGRGTLDDVDMLAVLGNAASMALDGVAPLLAGEWFKKSGSGISDQDLSDILQ